MPLWGMRLGKEMWPFCQHSGARLTRRRDKAKMTILRAITMSVLLCSVFSSKLKAKDIPRIAFFGEDVEILTSLTRSTEVLFKPSFLVLGGSEKVLMKDGNITDNRVTLNHLNHLVLENVGEDDEGEYVITNDDPHSVKRIKLIVRDCSNEQNVKYGEIYNIPMHDVSLPIILEFRHSPNEINDSVGPVTVLLNQSLTPTEDYKTRLRASEQRVSLHGVTRADEGSYTILDSEMKVKKKMCLNVKEHQHFAHLPYAGTLKIHLYLNRSLVKVFYTPESDSKRRLVLDQGELVVPMDASLDGRFFVEGSLCILEHVRVTDKGLFQVTDLEDFPVSNVYLTVDPYKLPSLYVAIISLLSLLAFLLCVCLFSCMLKVHRRAEKAKAIAKIAQHAGKEEGETFRQVVHDAYARFTEESSLQSQWDSNTDKTEVDIKGLEVSKPGQYRPLSPDKNNMETSDSGVEFNTAALPLDSDTDGLPTYTSQKLLLDSELMNGTAVPEEKMNGQAEMDVDYKRKYKNLKRKLKFLVYEQECFQEELRRAQRKLLKVSRDKSFLLDRLLQYERVDEDSSDSEATASSDNSEGEGLKDREREGVKKRRGSPGIPPLASSSSPHLSLLSRPGMNPLQPAASTPYLSTLPFPPEYLAPSAERGKKERKAKTTKHKKDSAGKAVGPATSNYPSSAASPAPSGAPFSWVPRQMLSGDAPEDEGESEGDSDRAEEERGEGEEAELVIDIPNE
nr:INO80 complex subunit E isoform X2 [Paramormyrops kingsleyae]